MKGLNTELKLELLPERIILGGYRGSIAHGQMVKAEHPKGKHMGAARRELVDEFGFDPKHASHCIRIARMGIEFLSTGELTVERTDANELLSIKRGEWSLERVKEEAARLFAKAEDALIHSPLPPKPDMPKIEALLMAMVEEGIQGFRAEEESHV